MSTPETPPLNVRMSAEDLEELVYLLSFGARRNPDAAQRMYFAAMLARLKANNPDIVI